MPRSCASVSSPNAPGRVCALGYHVRVNRDETSEPTRLIRALASDPQAGDRLLPYLYTELHQMAQAIMRGERQDHTLQATALIHEAWLRLSGETDGCEGRSHFLALAARAMRHALVDHARARNAQKRGGDLNRVTLDEGISDVVAESADILAIDEALTRLAEFDPDLARLVELRFFAGLKHEEVARALGCSLRSVERKWRLARAWMLTALDDADPDGESA